jgi:hypothetical protein
LHFSLNFSVLHDCRSIFSLVFFSGVPLGWMEIPRCHFSHQSLFVPANSCIYALLKKAAQPWSGRPSRNLCNTE